VEDHVALANRIGEGLRDAGFQPVPQTISKMDVCLRLVPNNEVVGHIDNDNWQAAQQVMAGQ
jgi:hypothetical protein